MVLSDYLMYSWVCVMYMTSIDYLGPAPDNRISSRPYLYEEISRSSDTNIVPLSEFKHYLNIDFSDDDALLQAILLAAIREVEQYCSIYLTITDIKTYRDIFFDEQSLRGVVGEGREYMTLYRRPFVSITSVSYLNKENESITIDPKTYYIQKTQDYAILALAPGEKWPNDVSPKLGSIAIEFKVGFQLVPSLLKLAIKQIGANYYSNRGDDSSDIMPIPKHCKTILNQFRRILI